MAAPFSRALLLRGAPRRRPATAPSRGLAGSEAAGGGGRWKLFGALCLQRPPVVSQALSPEEAEMAQLFQQLEMEKSVYSAHETQRFAEEERLKRIAEKGYDDKEDKGVLGKKIVMTQDLEDMWEQKLQAHKCAPRVTEADQNNDRTSLHRKLDQSLVLLVKQKLGDQTVWLLPQMEWEAGETLRGTAERALTALTGDPWQAKFLGNAPCGVYKHKFPRAQRAGGCPGGKVFFFKALLRPDGPFPLDREREDHVWVSKGELADYVTPAYHAQVTRFLVDL